MKGSIKERMQSIVRNLRAKNNPLNPSEPKADRELKEEKSVNKDEKNNHDDMNSEEQREAQFLFNNPENMQKDDEMNQEGRDDVPQLKSILKQNKIAAEEFDKKSKTVSFYEEERPIYLMTMEKKWNDEIKDKKEGKFEPQEQRILCDAVGQFLATNEIEFDEFKKMISQGSNGILRRQKFFKLLSNVIPNRSPQSCYKYILRQFNEMNHRGPWSEQEVEHLLALVDKYGRKWKMIGKELNRTNDNVYDKYRSLGEQAHEERVKKVWKLHELVALLTQIESESKIQFLDPKIKQVLMQEQEHDIFEIKELQNHKYNSKSFVFHNIEVVRPYIDAKSMKSVNLEKLKWRKIVRLVPSKSSFDCRNKFIQILQVAFKNNQELDDILVAFLEKQNVTNEVQINWKKWKTREFKPEEARNRLMIMKKLIEGRSKKQFSTIVQELRNKINKKREKLQEI